VCQTTTTIEWKLALRAWKRHDIFLLLAHVNAGVLGGTYDHQIFGPIIQFVFVDVVDVLALAKSGSF
jgi:hypothetical protein